jgi:hypothetical protein
MSTRNILIFDNRINSSQNATKIGMKLPHGHNIKPRIKCVAEIDKNLPSLAGDAALVSDILSHTCPNDCSSKA